MDEFAGATQLPSFHVDRTLTKQDAHGPHAHVVKKAP
jgi:hypothetical protein